MVQGFLPMLLTCAYWSPQEEKKVPSSELGNGMVLWGVLRMLRVPWEVNEKNHYVRQSPSECLVMTVQVVSVKKSIQSIVMEDLFWVVMSNDEQWR